MKAKLLIGSLLLGTTLLAVAKDPVLMTINGKDIKLSEFEYLYHKNNQQQIEKETLEQYVDRFVLYKQKVADAEANGLDTTQTFKSEFEGYKNDLSAPYIKEDTTYRWQFIQEAYERSKKEIAIDHFMLPLGTSDEANQAALARMDSIRNCILAGEDWSALADKYSSDPSKQRNHGHYGYIGASMFPYDFENVVYSTPVGEISKPFRTQFGIHMVRVDSVRPYDGVHAKHILKLFPRNATEEQKAVVKQQIDSVYQLLLAGADFEETAKTQSMDGTARRGGDLGWFGHGRMVKPFEEVAFSLADGAISEPFATQFGYHIVKKIAHGSPSLEELRPNIENAINRDQRANLIHERRLKDLQAKYNYKLNPSVEPYLFSALNQSGKYDSTFVATKIKGSTLPLFYYGDKKSEPLSKLATVLNNKAKFPDNVKAKDYMLAYTDVLAEKVLMDYHSHQLLEENEDFRNLINEYRDGMLLFDISNRRVWKAATKDTLGLEQHFAANRSKYTWDEPHFKGIILSAKNDTVLNAVKADMNTVAADQLTEFLHNKYGNDIRMERMVVKKGENNIADYLAFNSGVVPERKGYTEFMILEGKVLATPEEMSDVRGAVTSDYQDVLEQRWKEELAKKYPAKINKKVLKQVK